MMLAEMMSSKDLLPAKRDLTNAVSPLWGKKRGHSLGFLLWVLGDAHIHVWVERCTCIQVFGGVNTGEGQRTMSGVFFWALSTNCLRQGLPLSGHLSSFFRKLASMLGPASLILPSLELYHLPFYMVFMNLQADFHACKANALPTDLFSQS